MAYLDVITLADAKLYLRIDDGMNEDDAQIERMIKSCLSMVETWTNIYVFARNKTYGFPYRQCFNIYDHPINSVVSPTEGVTQVNKGLYSTFSGTQEITLNIGYTDPDEVPSELTDAALQMLKVFYYESQKQVNTTLIPESVKQILDTNKRFIL